MQGVAFFAKREAAGEPARCFERFLDVAAEVDQVDVGLQVDLRLAIGAHATDHTPQLVVPETERGDQGVQRRLAGRQAVRVGRVE